MMDYKQMSLLEDSLVSPLAKQEAASVAPDRLDTKTESAVPPLGAWGIRSSLNMIRKDRCKLTQEENVDGAVVVPVVG